MSNSNNKINNNNNNNTYTGKTNVTMSTNDNDYLFVVHVRPDLKSDIEQLSYIANKTYDEIVAADEDGKVILLTTSLHISVNKVFHLVYVDEENGIVVFSSGTYFNNEAHGNYLSLTEEFIAINQNNQVVITRKNANVLTTASMV